MLGNVASPGKRSLNFFTYLKQWLHSKAEERGFQSKRFHCLKGEGLDEAGLALDSSLGLDAVDGLYFDASDPGRGSFNKQLVAGSGS